MAITMFISLYTTRLILNALGVVDFGIYAIVGGAIGMLGFLNGAMSSATQRFMNYAEGQGNQEKKTGVFNVSIVIHFCLAFVIAIVLIIAGFVYFNGILNIPENRILAAKFVYGSLVFSTFLTVINVPYEAVMNAHENMRYYALVGILESLLKLIIAFVCVSTNYDKLVIYGILMACIPVVTLSIMKVYCHKRYSECLLNPFKYFRKDIAKEMLGFTGWNFLGSSSSMIGNYGNGLVLNHFYGSALNAAAGIANQLNGQLLVFSNNMLKALNPVITKSEGAGNRAGMLKYATLGCKYSFALLAFFAIPFFIEMDFIQHKWLQNVPSWAVLFAQLQIVRNLIEQLSIPYGSAIAAEGRIGKFNVFESILNLLPVSILFILFSKGFSPVIMYVLNISIFGVLVALVRVIFAHKICGLKYSSFFKELFLPSITAFILSFSIAFIPQLYMEQSWCRMIFTFALGFLSYIPLFYFLCMNENERSLIKTVFFNLKNRFKR